MKEWTVEQRVIDQANTVLSKHGEQATREYLNFEHWRRNLEEEETKEGRAKRLTHVLLGYWHNILRWLS